MPNTWTSLHYQIVFSTKERHPLLRDPGRMHQVLGGCIKDIGGLPIEIGGVSDHVHIALRLKPTHCVSDVVRDIKRRSSEWARTTNSRFYWQDGYAAFAVSLPGLASLRGYIRNQEAHHRRTNFVDEYRALLEEQGIEFDERYLF